MDQSVQDTLAEAFNAAPPYVQDYVRSGKYEEFLEGIRVLGNFHVDTMKIISDELLMMLLGMTEPRELPESLKTQAKLTDEQTSLVIEYANDEIFAPVREAALAPQAPERTPPPPLVPAPQIAQSVPAAAPAVVPGYPPDPTRPAAAYVPPPVPTPPPITPAPTAPIAPPVPAAQPPMRTMARDVENLGKGSAGGWTPPTPAPPPAPVAVPQMPVAAPTAMPEPVRPPVSAAAPAVPTTSTPKAPDYAEVSATLKQYGIDPYREPVE